MSGQRCHRQHYPGPGRPTRATLRQGTMGQQQEQWQPSRRRVEIQIADVGHEQVREGEGQSTEQRSGPAQAQSPRQGE